MRRLLIPFAVAVITAVITALSLVTPAVAAERLTDGSVITLQPGQKLTGDYVVHFNPPGDGHPPTVQAKIFLFGPSEPPFGFCPVKARFEKEQFPNTPIPSDVTFRVEWEAPADAGPHRCELSLSYLVGQGSRFQRTKLVFDIGGSAPTTTEPPASTEPPTTEPPTTTEPPATTEPPTTSVIEYPPLAPPPPPPPGGGVLPFTGGAAPFLGALGVSLLTFGAGVLLVMRRRPRHRT